jgi:DNA-binding beta-propeller fold protein YncE
VVAAGTVCATLGALSLPAAPASAMLSFPFDGQIAPTSGSFGRTEPGGPVLGNPALGGVAVNDFNGETYVAEEPTAQASEHGGLDAVDVFDSAGAELPPLEAALTPAGSFGAGAILLAANNATGEVYVLDSTHQVVDVFDSSGGYLCQISGAATPSLSECNGPAGSDTPAHGFLVPQGIAVDQATGEVYVLDQQNGVIDVFSVAGAYVRQIELSQIPSGFQPERMRDLAVSAFNGHVFVVEGADPTAIVHEFDAAGAYVTTWTGGNTPAGSFGNGEPTVAVEDKNGNVYITSNTEKVTDVFDSTGAYLTQFSHSYHIPRATAVDQANGKVYVSDAVDETSSILQVVDVFGPGVIVPDVTTLAASNVEAHRATLQGVLNPDEQPLSDCHFEYGTDTSYGQNVPCVPAAGSIPPDGEEHQVTAEITGLQAGTTYHFRLVAANAAGSNAGSDETLSTLPGPAIDSTAAKNLTSTAAELTAEINPEGADTTYRFEWGATSAYGNSVPVPDQDIGSESSDVAVAQEIGGLSPGATYHWRVVATNSRDTTTGVDHSFTYSAAASELPDGRAYEMVTPAAKNGALIGGALFTASPDVAADGSRVMVTSIQCFAESPSCTAARGNEGEPFSFSRTSSGWQTTALAPPPTEVNSNSSWSLNASTGTALFTIPTQPGEQDDFYTREPDGSFIDIGPVTEPARGPLGPVFQNSRYVGTEGFQHLAFEEQHPAWSFDSSKHQTLYELSGPGNSAPELVGVSGGHGSTSLISECATELAGETHHALSTDGSVIVFVAGGHDRSGCASGTTAPPVDELYARLSSSTTVAISRAISFECTTSACTKAPASDGQFADVSADGTKVFFTDTQQLTDAASEDSRPGDSSVSGCEATIGSNGCNLYEHDLGEPDGHRLIAVSAGDTSGLGPDVQRVIAVSADGSHVYFVAKGVLSASANDQGVRPLAGGENMYVFERDASHPAGQTAFLATLSHADTEESVTGVSRPSVTPDGRFLVFTSHGDLTVDDDSSSSAAQVFRYDAQEERLVRVSIGEHGFNDNGNTFHEGLCELQGRTCPRDARIAQPTNVTRRDPTMSDDGSYVFFRSPVGLTPQALNDVAVGTTGQGAPLYAQNVYEYHNGHIYLISDGKDTTQLGGASAVELLGSDQTGANVFFSTSDQLAPQDTDTQRDYYDARICTAASPCISPAAPPLPPCLGEACHGTPAATPPGISPPSATFSGSGNTQTPPSTPAPKTAAQIRAARLAKALKSCRAKHDRRKRVACEARARKRYGRKAKPHLKAHSKSRKGGK